MNRPLRIGFLSPYSGIYPHYGLHFTAGWLLGMGLNPFQQKKVEFVFEYSKMGGSSATGEALRKLCFFDRVDFVSGLVNYRSLEEHVGVLKNHLALFFDMGELVPNQSILRSNIFYASHQLWQSEYALGSWAQKAFGDGGFVIMPIYEAGFHFSSCFQAGVANAGGENMHIQVLAKEEQLGNQLNLELFFRELEDKKPPYVHAIFSGEQGTYFLSEWAKSKFHKTIPLVINESMAYADVLQDVEHLGLEVFTSLMWDKENESKINQQFVKQFETVCQQPANVFGMRGYEVGLLWKELYPLFEKNDWSKIRDLLVTEHLEGPSGQVNFCPESEYNIPKVSIAKINTSQNSQKKLILDEVNGMFYNAEIFNELHEHSVSGWQNPFLCV